jgi:hypothetical protein
LNYEYHYAALISKAKNRSIRTKDIVEVFKERFSRITRVGVDEFYSYAKTSERFCNSARQQHPNAGKTKENNPGTAAQAEKIRGRTKENNEGVRIMAEKLKNRAKKK